METLTITLDEAAKISGIARDALEYFRDTDPTFPCFMIKGRKRWWVVREAFIQWVKDSGTKRVGMRTTPPTIVEIHKKRAQGRKAVRTA